MDRIKAGQYLSIAAKAGYLIIGSDTLDTYKHKLYLLLIDSTAGKYAQKIAARFESKGIKTMKVDNLGEILKMPNCKICGVKNMALAQIICENLI